MSLAFTLVTVETPVGVGAAEATLAVEVAAEFQAAWAGFLSFGGVEAGAGAASAGGAAITAGGAAGLPLPVIIAGGAVGAAAAAVAVGVATQTQTGPVEIVPPPLPKSCNPTTQQACQEKGLVVRGGLNTPDRIIHGSGVITDAIGNVYGVSANSFPGLSVFQLVVGLMNKFIGVTTVGAIHGLGGSITATPSPDNPYHSTVSGISANALSALLQPHIPNPAYAP